MREYRKPPSKWDQFLAGLVFVAILVMIFLIKDLIEIIK